MTALMASMVCVATMIIKIPSPLKGYMNIGDCIVLLCGWLLPPSYGFIAAGFGSALADLISGYFIYAPVTFIIKGGMSIIAFACFKFMHKKIGKLSSQIVGGVFAEMLMIFGYYVYEGFLYGFVASLVNIPANIAQGVAGFVLGVALIKVFEKFKITLD